MVGTLFFVLLLTVKEFQAERWQGTCEFTGFRLKQGLALPHRVGSDVQCAHDCAQTNGCMVASYDVSSDVCIESHKWRVKIAESASSTFVVVRNISMLVIAESYNFSQAQDACQRLMSQMVTLAELEEAYTNNVSMCKCLWLSDGTNKALVQEGDGCNGKAVGLTDCAHTFAHALCTNMECIGS